MLYRFSLVILFTISSFISAKLSAQTFGFGCLGFVGGYGGFTYQQFNPKGLNETIQWYNENQNTISKMENFKYATGYRVGLNFFRATFENKIIITAKGYYQSLSKKNKSSYITTSGPDSWQVDYSLGLDLKNWAIGLDVGWELVDPISWKILDGALHFNNVTLTETSDMPGDTYVRKLKGETNFIGYSVGTGMIVNIIKDYISIEGLAGYTFLSVDDVHDSNGYSFLNPNNITPSAIDSKFIDSGGFSAVVQLNVGFPL